MRAIVPTHSANTCDALRLQPDVTSDIRHISPRATRSAVRHKPCNLPSHVQQLSSHLMQSA